MFLWRENSGGFHAEAVVLNRPIGFGFKSIDEQEFHRKRAVSPLGVILKYLEEWGERVGGSGASQLLDGHRRNPFRECSVM